MKNYAFVILLMIGIQTSVAASSNALVVDRYSSVSEAATPAQLNPLLTVVTVKFPDSVTTIGQAVNQVLVYSGYSLAPENQLPCALKTVLSKPLPLADRTFQPMMIRDMVGVLVGKNHFRLTQDSINRTVNFNVINLSAKEAHVCK